MDSDVQMTPINIIVISCYSQRSSSEDLWNSPTHVCITLQAQFVDVISINRYYGWYSDTGHAEVILLQLSTELEAWRARHRKPIIISEYGADTIPGLHQVKYIFTSFSLGTCLSEGRANNRMARWKH